MMAINQVKIANMALSHCGVKSRIESLTEDSNEAKNVELWYDFSLLESLEAYDWTFARTRTPKGTSLALDGDDPPDEWMFRYQYPVDCVKARRIWNPAGQSADAIPFEIELNSKKVRTILTNMEDPILVYTSLVTDVNQFIPIFVSMLSRAIASHIAFSLTAKQAIADAQTNAFAALLRLAPAVDANEHVAQPPRDAEWVRGRTFDPQAFIRRQD